MRFPLQPMALSEQEILKFLMQSRERVAAEAWVVVRDAHVAEDIFQNTVLKAVTKEVSFEADAALLSWAFITARREAVDWVRKHRRESVGFPPAVLELLEADWQREQAGPAGARIDALRDCVEGLPEKSRDLLRLRYFEGFSCGEIAGRIDARLDAVYKRLSRLHEALRECVEGKLERGMTA